MEKNKVLTKSNFLSLVRIILIPIFIVFFLFDNFYLDGSYPIYAILVFIFACVLDILDETSKETPNSTNFEKVLDPIIDKIFRNAVTIMSVIKGILPLFVAILLGAIDLITLVLGTYLFSKKIVFKANTFGKITTIVTSISLFSCFLKVVIYPINLILMLISIAMIIISLITYIVKFYKLYNIN